MVVINGKHDCRNVLNCSWGTVFRKSDCTGPFCNFERAVCVRSVAEDPTELGNKNYVTKFTLNEIEPYPDE